MGKFAGWLMERGVESDLATFWTTLVAVAVVVLVSILADLLARRVILQTLIRLIRRTKFTWDDELLGHNVLRYLAHYAPALVVYAATPDVLAAYPWLAQFVRALAYLYMIVIGAMTLTSFLNVVVDIYRRSQRSRQVPLKGFVQVLQVIVWVVAVILILSVVLKKSPIYLFSGLGAMTAVTMLIFKDSILGLVAGIQLSANRMVSLGDWIEMPTYGADGDVIDITLTTVKVQNWDKTISTIPTYALISNSFKNWRGMSESGGRRIKRAIAVDMNSVKFCDEEMLSRFVKIRYIQAYLDAKREEIREYNAETKVDDASLVNGRRLTNLGTFRAYVQAYLRNHPDIHDTGMTFLVRQLAPTEKGLPIEIYVFSRNQNWVAYEGIQADIFDHLLAVIPEFDLRVFQNPTGSDFARLG